MYTEGKTTWKSFPNLQGNTQWRQLILKRKKSSYQETSSRNYLRKQKFVIFVNKKLKLNLLKIKDVVKVRDHGPYVGEYRSAAHSTCSLYSVPKEIPIIFRNGYNYYYHQ